jgi:tellurium resistance protein TerD
MSETIGTVDLRKGASINLSKAAPGVHIYKIGLGWNAVHKPGRMRPTWTPPPSCARTTRTATPNLLDPATNIVFYGNNDKSADGAVIYGGDNRTGDGDGDDETITVDVSKLDPHVDQIIFAVTSYVEAGEHKYTFGEVNKAYIRCLDANAHDAWEQPPATRPRPSRCWRSTSSPTTTAPIPRSSSARSTAATKATGASRRWASARSRNWRTSSTCSLRAW